MQILPAALEPFRAFPQFVLYKLVPGKKTGKLPVDWRTGRVPEKGNGGAHDPAIWTDADTALRALATMGTGYGLGFVFTANDPFWFLDVDGAAVDGQWSPIARQLIDAFPGAAVEVSTSGTGLHLFGTGAVPAHACKNIALGLEFYTEGRFAALTGTHASGSAATDHTVNLQWLVQHYFPPRDGANGDFSDWDAACERGPRVDWIGPTEDAELLRRALKSSSLAADFGGGIRFADLWECRVDALARSYPDGERAYDASSADRALAQMLAFWTGCDCARIERLMQQSALVRDKWSERDDYLPRTILGAVAVQRDVLTDRLPEPVHTDAVPPPTTNGVEYEPLQGTDVTGETFIHGDAQKKHFEGCVLVLEQQRVLVPGGQLLRPEQFRAAYGGYTYVLTADGERVTRNAWEAFTESHVIRPPRAHTTCFRPDLSPGAVVNDGGRLMANTWWPVEVRRMVGDVTPFMMHLEKLLPNERDRTILLSYMAACVQHVGVKFQWAPLIQGAEGNGKTLFTRCIAEAVGRRYTHMPRADEMGEKFNSWLFGMVFIGVEDIYVPEQKRDLIEVLKPMITGEYQAKRAMQTDQAMANVVCNFLFNSNHRDAIRKTRNDRRFCVFYTAQQSEHDIAKHGMGVEYMVNLYNWLKADGYAIVSEFLHTWPIPPEFNPAGSCQRAPVTSSTDSAIMLSLGLVEQEIMEAIEQSLPGFAGGWVSSMYLDNMLDRLRRTIPRNKRRELMQSIGYDWHPALLNGRAQHPVLPEGGKPILYIRKNHPHLSLTSSSEVERAYSEAQKQFAKTN